MGRDVTYFSTLSREALGLIVRHCSFNSWDYRWECSVDPNALRALVLLRCEDMQDIITQVSDHEGVYNFGHISKLLSTVERIDIQTCENARHAGNHAESLKELKVHSFSFMGEKILEEILVPRGYQLLKLDTTITSRREAMLIAAHCSQIRELSLYSCSKNAHLDCGFASTESLNLILLGVGRNLHKFEIDIRLSAAELTTIREYCPFLHTLNVTNYYTKSDAYAALLASYGGFLRRAHLPITFTEDDIRKVVSNCPNVKLTIVLNCWMSYVLNGLGEHIVELELKGEEISMEHVQQVWTHCTALREFKAKYGNGLKRDLIQPFPNLTSLRSLELSDFDLDSSAFGAIAENTRSLEELELWLMEYNSCVAMNHLVTNNKQLRKVVLYIPFNYESDDSRIPHQLKQPELAMTLDTVKIFSKCKELREFWLIGYCVCQRTERRFIHYPKYYHEVDDALSHSLLRRRNMRVVILGHSYLPIGY